ncbi:translocation/assembly module TamB domain-containing protein [Gracilimonas sp. Q87]|uniref:translocation/assembly module TamB domain-containing protein n=1 Tax=Gracilimonas sp. Q87 TaxID=3384766 RepID=UPI0039843852
MSEDKKHIFEKVWIKRTAWTLLSVIILLGGLRLSLKTTLVRDFVKKQIVSVTNSTINGTLDISSLEGDLWNNFNITGISLIDQKTDTLLTVSKVQINHSLLKLVTLTYQSSLITIDGMKVYLKENSSGGFNAQQLIPRDTTETDSGSPINFDLQDIRLLNSAIYVNSPSYLPDQRLSITDVNARAQFKLFDEFSASLSKLDLKINEGRLPKPIALSASAGYEGKQITLNELILGTGRSFLEANASTNLRDSTLNAAFQAAPFSFTDLKPYIDQPLPDENLQLSLTAKGTFDSFDIEISGAGTGFDDLQFITTVSLSEQPSLKKIGLSGSNLDIRYYTGDSVDANISNFQITAEGYLGRDLKKADLIWGFTLDNITYENYRLQTLFGSGSLKNETVLANVEMRDGQESIVLNTDVEQILSTDPEWVLDISVRKLNPARWMKTPEMSGVVSLNARASGTGFTLSETPWKYAFFKRKNPVVTDDPSNADFGDRISLRSKPIELAGYRIPDLSVTGSINSDEITTKGFVDLFDNRINFRAAVQQLLQKKRSFTFQTSTSSFNIADLPDLESLPSSINLNVTGNGSFTDPENLSLETLVQIDSSSINGASLDSLTIDAEMQDNILKIRNGQLASEVIAGNFSGRRNLTDRTDPDNNFSLNMEILNLQPIASIAEADVLEATGTLTGKVSEVVDNELLFDGNISLSDFQYDSLFTANKISGSTKISIRDEYGFDFTLNIEQPIINDVALQDITLQTIGVSTNEFMSGYFNFDIISEDAGEITQSGDFAVNLSNLRTELSWDFLEFRTQAQTLSLEQPFNLVYEDASIKTDTLRLGSKDEAYLNFAVPYADTLSQRFWMQAKNCDFGVIQETIFDERFVDGVLSGGFTLENTDSTFTGNGALNIENLSYLGTQAERFSIDFHLQDERLSAGLSIIMQEEEKVAGRFNVPFVPESPESLSDSFFNEPVSGSFQIFPIPLDEIKGILEEFQITQTDGILSFEGMLSGTAGEPDLGGNFTLTEPTLSGISIDSASASFSYDHTQKNITALTRIDARGQRAASIEAKIPISMDFRTFEIQMPGPEDSLSMNLITDDFNISVFNDFLDKQFTRNLKGTLNADVNISGTKTDLKSEGHLRLDKGRLSVPIAGITLTDINSEIQLLENGHLDLNRFNMKSGSGNFTASGAIELEGITPTKLDLNAKASRFRLANTDNYNLTIDLNSNISGDPLRPKASGSLTIKNGFIYLQNFGEKAVEDVQLEEEEASSFSPYDSLAMDMTFVIEQDFFIRNSRYLDMEIEINGELEAQKQTAGELQLFGTLDAGDGYVRPLGKQFNLEEGRFTFSGPLENPNILVSTSYIPQTAQKQGDPITLYYIIDGTAQEPEFRFESEPQMEQQDIICYTLFNKPCYALDSWQQVVSGGGGSSPTDLLMGVLLDEVEALATQELGIDVVQIETLNTGSDAGTTTSIKTGWYLNRRTFFAIINEITGTTPETMFILEYMLNNNLDLILTQGDERQQGIDLRWHYDY